MDHSSLAREYASRLTLFAGNGALNLAQKIGDHLSLSLVSDQYPLTTHQSLRP
ncbi:MAG: hypothetical protein GW911_10510 [Armatimonadetes bacterium]|nr:hypothetical protein [Armatimonadota bacterium]NCO92550.1 hypothetical protein [Armatimonadota bacterium]NCP28748.1 hypothetical protein [Armatimonadota bacterium]NCQ26076.1 hypothetical protein [Armatimonadota bacterium]NDK12472.1 hypothetical protein [Armatimonadota bacterium]